MYKAGDKKHENVKKKIKDENAQKNYNESVQIRKKIEFPKKNTTKMKKCVKQVTKKMKMSQKNENVQIRKK